MGDIIKGMGARYSTRNLNTNNTQRTVSLRDSKSGQIVAVGFEDNIDFDYADAIFYIHTSEKNAIDPTLPPLHEDPEAIPELGGDSIRSFAFAMILGVVIGTLSSLFIASPIAYNMMKNKKVVVPATEE